MGYCLVMDTGTLTFAHPVAGCSNWPWEAMPIMQDTISCLSPFERAWIQDTVPWQFTWMVSWTVP